MRVIELRIWERNDYGHVLVAFGLTVMNFYVAVTKDRTGWMVRLGNWDGRGRDWRIGNAA